MIVPAKLLRLKNVDYTRHGETVSIMVDGKTRSQTVIFTARDYWDERYFFTEEALRYIHDARRRRPYQEFVLDYLHKLPSILATPSIIGRSLVDPASHIYGKAISRSAAEQTRYLLLAVLKKSNINVVWNLYWAEDNRVPHETEMLFVDKAGRKFLR